MKFHSEPEQDKQAASGENSGAAQTSAEERAKRRLKRAMELSRSQWSRTGKVMK